jgi:DNA-binding MarR family transcriptional regulator
MNHSYHESFTSATVLDVTGTGDGEARAGQVAFLLAQVGGLAAIRFAERIGPLGLTPPQAGLLRAVSAGPGRSQQALATELGVLPSTLVALVDELEEDGLLMRTRNPSDRRNYALQLTSAGDQRLQEIGRMARAHGDDLLAPLGQDDRLILARVLGQLAEHHGLTPGVHPGYRSLGGRG